MGRRRDELRKLQNERARLRQVDKTFISSTDRDALLVSGDGKQYGRESEVTRDMTTQQLVDRSQVEIKAQDEILDQMSRGLDGLKNMGVAIRDETTLHMVRPTACARARVLDGTLLCLKSALPLRRAHVHPRAQKLLDTLENEVDSGNSALKRETARTEAVTRDARTCWLYVVICILLAVLMLLVALRWW